MAPLYDEMRHNAEVQAGGITFKSSYLLARLRSEYDASAQPHFTGCAGDFFDLPIVSLIALEDAVVVVYFGCYEQTGYFGGHVVVVGKGVLCFAQEHVATRWPLQAANVAPMRREKREGYAMLDTEFHQSRTGTHIAKGDDGRYVERRDAEYFFLLDGNDDVLSVFAQIGLWRRDVERVK